MVVAALLAAVFVPLGLTRLVDTDEGIYLQNARQILDGQLPFHDFHWPQMFLTPYLYAGWMAIAGVGWYSARVFSALLAVLLGLALYHHVVVTTGRRAGAAVAAIVFASSSLAFAWLPLVKTYPFGALALFLAYGVLAWAPERWRYLLSGLLLGLAIDVRLYIVLVAPVLAATVVRRTPSPGSPDGASTPARDLACFGLGLAAALAPNAWFVLIDPAAFYFNVVGHHAVRSPEGLVGALPQKLEALGNMVGINGSFGATSFQFTLLSMANVAWLGMALARRARPPLSLQISGVMLVASLLPTPAYGQYFAMFLPFLIVGAVEMVAAIAGGLRASPASAVLARPLGTAVAVLVLIYVAVAPIDVWWFTRGGDIVPGVFAKANVRNWTIPAINDVSRAIDEAMPPGGTTAISWWPGYFVDTRTRVFAPLANPFVLWLTPRMRREDIDRYHLVTHDDVARAIRARVVPVIVLGNWVPLAERAPYRMVIAGSGYEVVRAVGDTEIYRLAPRPGTPERAAAR